EVSRVYGSSDDQERKEVAFWHLYEWLKERLPTIAPGYDVAPSPVPRHLIVWRTELVTRHGAALQRFMSVEHDRYPELAFGQYGQSRIPGVLRCQNVRASSAVDPEAAECCAVREYSKELEIAFDVATSLTYRGAANVSDIESHYGVIPEKVRTYLDDLVAGGD